MRSNILEHFAKWKIENGWFQLPYLVVISLPTTDYSSSSLSGVRHYCCVNFTRAIQTVDIHIFTVRVSLFSALVCESVLNTQYQLQHHPVLMRLLYALRPCACVWVPFFCYNDGIEFFALSTRKSNSTPIMVICWTEWLMFIIKIWKDGEKKRWNC